jgi:hypothetical protein
MQMEEARQRKAAASATPESPSGRWPDGDRPPPARSSYPPPGVGGGGGGGGGGRISLDNLFPDLSGVPPLAILQVPSTRTRQMLCVMQERIGGQLRAACGRKVVHNLGTVRRSVVETSRKPGTVPK